MRGTPGCSLNGPRAVPSRARTRVFPVRKLIVAGPAGRVHEKMALGTKCLATTPGKAGCEIRYRLRSWVVGIGRWRLNCGGVGRSSSPLAAERFTRSEEHTSELQSR